MLIRVLSFLSRHPILGIAVTSALLLFITGPKLIEGAKVRDYIPGIESYETSVKALNFGYHRVKRAGQVRDCHATVDINGAKTSVQVDCDEWDTLAVGSPLSVVRYGDNLIARSFVQGSFYIDLVLALVEIIGLGYFVAILALPRATAVNRTAALR